MISEGFYLSKWQGRANNDGTYSYISDLKRLREKPTIGFFWIKGTQGLTGVDPLWAAGRKDADNSGVPFGAFHYFVNRADPIMQARHFWNVCGGANHGLKVLPALDAEDPNNTDDPQITNKFADFVGECDVLWGSKNIIYTRKSFWNPVYRHNSLVPDPRFGNRPWWLAHYSSVVSAPALPVDAATYAVWQIGIRVAGEIPGVPAVATRELLNPHMAVADICFPNSGTPDVPPTTSLIKKWIDNQNLMLQDIQETGNVAPYIPVKRT